MTPSLTMNQPHAPQSRTMTESHAFPTGLVPAVEFTRGGSVESVHHAAAAVVDHTGRVLARIGDPQLVTLTRSSLKPFQALASVLRGYPECFGLTARHLALGCASHSGEPQHIQAAQEILDAIGAGIADLNCGVHIPLHLKAEEGGIPRKSEFSAIHNNCSGKHSTMLALARLLDAPLSGYLDYGHSVQAAIREAITTATGCDAARAASGIDGCSAPNYAMPLAALATGFARYARAVARAESELDSTERAAAKIARAMMTHPEMVSGTGRFDLTLSNALDRAIFAKSGAEAIQGVGIPSKGWGVVIKIGDGTGRGLPPLMVSLLDQLGVLDDAARARLESVGAPRLKNLRGLEVGVARCVAQVEWL